MMKTFLKIVSAPFIGLAYVVSLPFIGMAVMAFYLGKAILKLVHSLINQSMSLVAFGWRPMEAYFLGKRKSKKDKNDSEV